MIEEHYFELNGVMATNKWIGNYYESAESLDACRKFFFDIKWPTGYYCEK